MRSFLEISVAVICRMTGGSQGCRGRSEGVLTAEASVSSGEVVAGEVEGRD